MVKIYMARAMSGRIMEDVVNEAVNDRDVLKNYDLTALDPVAEEGVKPKKKKLKSSYADMVGYWKRDKAMIREAHILFDMTPNMKSEGVAHEIGYARYFLWKPVVRVYRDGKKPPRSSIASFEDDVIAGSIAEACHYAHVYWGTPWRRLKWRLAMYNRSFLSAMFYKLKEWWVL